MKVYFSLILFVFSGIISIGQVPVGSWRTHLPCNKAIDLAYASDKVYCSTGESLFSYNLKDNSVEKKSKINGLSDFGVSAIAYSDDQKLLIIGYENGNIDLVKGKETVNIAELKRKSLSASKAINHILCNGKWAYLSCGFGIILVDLEKYEIKDTYVFGPLGTYIQVNSSAIFNGDLIAATASGLYKAVKDDPYLVDYSRWSRITNVPNYDKSFRQAIVNNDILYALYSNPNPGLDTIYYSTANDWDRFQMDENTDIWNISFSSDKIFLATSINLKIYNFSNQLIHTLWQYGDVGAAQPRKVYVDKSGILWIADFGNGLIQQYPDSRINQIMPNGPLSNRVKAFHYSNGKLYVTAGGVDGSFDNLYNQAEYSVFSDNEWSSYTKSGVFDFMVAKSDPIDKDLIYIGSYGSGVFIYKNGEIVNHYNENNSSLQNAIPGGPFTRVAGMDFDSDRNLWISNSNVSNSLSVLKTNGDWLPFPLSAMLGVDFLGDVVIDDYNNVWMVLSKGGGIAVLNTNNTLDNKDDDRLISFRPRNLFEQTISNIYTITKDLDGNIWVGTDNGPVVYSSPDEVFEGNTNGLQPSIPRYDGNGTIDPLLGSEIIRCIAVDGANRKWLGTDRGGVFLVSADGDSTIHAFNTENSPILSNTILGIGIEEKTGEVFFGTDRGIISYRSDATKATDDFGDVYVFPNPVRPNYEGVVTVTGLIKDANVKITDIAGNIVFETKTLGGQAIWDGKNFDGRKVSSGIYMVFCTNEDGSKTTVTKILFLN